MTGKDYFRIRVVAPRSPNMNSCRCVNSEYTAYFWFQAEKNGSSCGYSDWTDGMTLPNRCASRLAIISHCGCGAAIH